MIITEVRESLPVVPPVYIRPEAFTVDVWQIIITTYGEVIDPNSLLDPQTMFNRTYDYQYALDDLKSRGAAEFRYGSSTSLHSKLWIKDVYRGKGVYQIYYSPNLDASLSLEASLRREARTLEIEFAIALRNKFQQLGVLVIDQASD